MEYLRCESSKSMAVSMEQKNMLTNLFHLYSTGVGEGNLNLNTFLSTAGSQKLFSAEVDGVYEVIRHINSCLGAAKHRVEGLRLLDSVVRECTTAVFQQHALTWIKLLINILQASSSTIDLVQRLGHSTREVYTRCCHVLSQILLHSRTFADVAREITSSVITQLIPLLIAASGKKKEAAFLCISQCIAQYPGPVGPFKGKLLGFVMETLQAGETSQELYRCFALLAGCGPGGTQGIKHTEAWSDLCTQLLASLHQTLDGLYQDVQPADRAPYQRRALGLSMIDDGSANRVMSLYKRWQALCNCMVYFLREEFNSVAKVPVIDILQLVYRCLAVNVSMLLIRETSERCLLATLVGKIHVSALNVLQQLILLCRTNLIAQGSQIVSVLVQELVWTHQATSTADHQYGYLRASVYGVLSTWMQCLRAGAGMVKEETTLVKELIHDCLPLTSTLQLNAGSQEGGGGSKKKRKQAGYQDISEGLSTQRKSNTLANERLVKAALDVLDWLVLTSGSFLNKKVMKEIHQFVVGTLARVQDSPVSPVPYSSPECRRGLYCVLQTCVLTPTPGLPSLTHYATRLFSTGIFDKNCQVSSCCMKAMAVCESLIHPRAPCLQAPTVSDTRLEINTPVPATSTNNAQLIPSNIQNGNCLISTSASATSNNQPVILETMNQSITTVASLTDCPNANSSVNTSVSSPQKAGSTKTARSVVVVAEDNSVATVTDVSMPDKVVVIDSDGNSKSEDEDDDDNDNADVVDMDVVTHTGSTVECCVMGIQSRKDGGQETKYKNSSAGKSPKSKKRNLTDESVNNKTDTTKAHSSAKKRQSAVDKVDDSNDGHISIDSDSDEGMDEKVVDGEQVMKTSPEQEVISDDDDPATMASQDMYRAEKLPGQGSSDQDQTSGDIEMMVATFVDAGPDSD